MRFITSEFSISFCIFPGGATGGRVFGAGVRLRPGNRSDGGGVVFGYSDGGARRTAAQWFPRRPYITREARERDLYRRGGERSTIAIPRLN